MRRLRETNEGHNSPQYFNGQFEDKPIDMENTLRQDKYLEILARHNIRKLVELGCGVSAFCPKASDIYDEVWGLDFSDRAIQRMRKEFPRVLYVLGDATSTDFDDESFDGVVSGELLEHLEKPQRLVDEMARICRVGGVMVLSTPHLEIDDPEHLWEFDEQDLVTMFSPYGKPTIETLNSEKFPGRKYLIVWTKRLR